MKSPLIRLSHERPMRCPLCDALLGANQMGVRSHFRRHLRELEGRPLAKPHTVFFQFLGAEYWRTSIFLEYMSNHSRQTSAARALGQVMAAVDSRHLWAVVKAARKADQPEGEAGK